MSYNAAHGFSIFDYIDKNSLDNYLNYLFTEDFGNGVDLTTDSIFKNQNKIISAQIVAKDNGIVAGTELYVYIIKKLNPDTEVKIHIHDGGKVVENDKILTITSEIITLLRSERLCLNFLGRLCGIATITQKFIEEVKGTKCKILDTRKTTPGIRFAEKYAVKAGGGTNHRMGLYDVILIKDNHIDGAGGITECVNRIRNSWGNKYRIITETRTIEEVKEALELNVDRILLDNMTVEMTKEAVRLSAGKMPLESSGNITLKNAKEIALTGVDFISTSYITAWAQPLDLSLKVIK
jgi:nicotinate-nucleotide pyrophosphorylase (carboxylating)